MNRYPIWKYVIVAISIVVGLVYTLPNFYGEVPAVQIASARATEKTDMALVKRVEKILKQAGISSTGVVLDKTGIKVRFSGTDTQIKAEDILQSTLGSGYTVALNLLPASPHWLTAINALPMYLGLDLRGGVYFLMQVDMKAALKKALDRYQGDIRALLRDKRIRYTGVAVQANTLIVHFSDTARRNAASAVIEKAYPELQLANGPSEDNPTLVAKLKLTTQKKTEQYALQQNLTTLRNRVNELGVAEPVIQQQGVNRVVVQLPGVQDTARAKEILGRTATLEIHMVDDEAMNDPARLQAAVSGQVPFGDDLFYDRKGHPILVHKNVVLTGDYITNAQPGFDQNGQPAVDINLNGSGARIFQDVTRANVGKRMAILLIEKNKTTVVTAPVIQEEIGGGRVQITGMQSIRSSKDVALLLRAGALAAPMNIVEERTVGPSMGKENIAKGFHSNIWGFIGVAFFMIFYYRVFGIFSMLALTANGLFLVALLSMWQATLTLPGMAGIALTLGMAIDANVLINERIREELRHGNTPQAAIAAGFDRAFDTILDSNITTLIAGIALFWLGSGPVRGFALVLCLGILTSMFSAVTVARAMVNLTYGRKARLTKVTI